MNFKYIFKILNLFFYYKIKIIFKLIYINFCNVTHKYIMDNIAKNYYKIINYLALFPATSSCMLFGTSS